MKNREIYEAALHLLAEPIDEDRLEDYASNAPYILGCFFYETSRLDEAYRKFNGLEPHGFTHAVCAELDEEFPFAERFVTAAVQYLAAMLVLEENGELSDKLFDMFCTSISKITSEIPGASESIINIY